MMKEAYCSFEVSKLLKEKGFNEPCRDFYRKENEEWLRRNTYEYNYFNLQMPRWEDCYACPTHQMAMKWLREEHKIFIYIEPYITTSGLQGYKPYCTKIGEEFMWINPLRKYSNTSLDTYEEAVEAALKYCLENLI